MQRRKSLNGGEAACGSKLELEQSRNLAVSKQRTGSVQSTVEQGAHRT